MIAKMRAERFYSFGYLAGIKELLRVHPYPRAWNLLSSRRPAPRAGPAFRRVDIG
jgi:hypothetical protein